MARDTRDRMIGAATLLLRERGYDGTGFREVVALAGAARGAIYHHFPGGKQQLGAAVASTTGGGIADRVEHVCANRGPAEAVTELLDLAERTLIAGDSVAGCPIAAVALAAEDPDGTLRQAADAVFTRWRAALTGCFTRAGIAKGDAESFAVLAVAGVEGAVLLCRARGDATAFGHVRAALLSQLPPAENPPDNSTS